MSIVIGIISALLGWGVYELVRRTHIPPVIAIIASIVLVVIICVFAVESSSLPKLGMPIGLFYGSWFLGYYEALKSKEKKETEKESNSKDGEA